MTIITPIIIGMTKTHTTTEQASTPATIGGVQDILLYATVGLTIMVGLQVGIGRGGFLEILATAM